MNENSGYGENIARARNRKGWSQAELARKVETSQQQIGRFEAGQDVRALMLVKIADALDVSLYRLLGLHETTEPDSTRDAELSATQTPAAARQPTAPVSEDDGMRIKLRECRNAVGMTQEAIADAIDRNVKTVNEWECGSRSPTATDVCRLCEVLGVDPNTLLGWRREQPGQPGITAPTPDEAELLANYRDCTPEWRQNIRMTSISARGESFRMSGHNSSSSICNAGPLQPTWGMRPAIEAGRKGLDMPHSG